MKTYLNYFLFFAVIFSVSIFGCQKENDEPAPELPPQGSFVMDFSDFSNPDDTLTGRSIQSYQNWGHSYVNVAVWSTIIKVGMAIPVAAFFESFNHEAVFHPNENNWTWSYNFTAGGIVHEAEITAYFVSDTVNWEMRISKEGAYTDFLWYTGKNSFDRSGGYWILNENPNNPNELLKIDWVYEGDGIGDLRYTNIKPNGPENGGYINYGTLSGEFDRFFNIYNKGQDNLTEIEWNHLNATGHVKDPAKFLDEDWHCWDSSLQDIDCP